MYPVYTVELFKDEKVFTPITEKVTAKFECLKSKHFLYALRNGGAAFCTIYVVRNGSVIDTIQCHNFASPISFSGLQHIAAQEEGMGQTVSVQWFACGDQLCVKTKDQYEQILKNNYWLVPE